MPQEDDQLSLTFAALADPTRRQIVARLAAGEATVNELAGPFDMSLQAVSKHLKVLERAGLITRGRAAQRRPARLQVAPFEAALEWIGSYRLAAAIQRPEPGPEGVQWSTAARMPPKSWSSRPGSGR